jgi:hypothetical protein
LRWVVDRRLVLAVGLIAAIPVLVSVARTVLDGWTPVLDDAVMATRSFDVFSAHSPLVGAYSDAMVARVGPVYGPGPMLFWLLAFQTRFLGDWALPVTMGVVNTASIVGVVALARRRGGRVLMFASALAMAAMLRSLPQATLHEIDNSRAGVLAFMLLLFLAWSVACGEYRLLPLTVLVASFVVQVHFSLGLPGLAVFLVGLAGLVRFLATSRSAGAVELASDRRRWSLGALVVALVCWSAPLLDQLLHSPGNFVRIWQTATAQQPTAGVTFGWRALASAIGVVPRWLRSYSSVGVELRDVAFPPSAVAVVSTVLILGALLIVGAVGLRRRRADVVAAAALALAVSAALVVATASLPAPLILREYALRWSSPAGMFCWLVLGWSLATVLRPMRWRAAQALTAWPAVRRQASASVIGVTITAIVAVVVASAPESDSLRWTYRPARRVASLLAARLPRSRSVLVEVSSWSGFQIQWGIIYRLRRGGYRVVAPSEALSLNLSQRLGAYYSPGGTGGAPRRYQDVLLIDVGNQPAPRQGRVIARVALHGAPAGLGALNAPPPTAVTVSVFPAPAQRAAAAGAAARGKAWGTRAAATSR